MATLLITGGAGFIGSNFVEYWYRNHPQDRVLVLDNLSYAGRLLNIPREIQANEERFAFWMGDVRSSDLLGELIGQADIVVHFAAETHVTRSILDSRIFFETDVLGTHSICSALIKHKATVKRFVHISTSEVYGSAEYQPMDESHPLNPCSPYAGAKCGADRLVYSFVKTYDIPGIILRPFNQYGPKQHLEKVVPRFIVSALQDQPLTVHGDGHARRDWMHVEDTCERIARTIAAPIAEVQGEVFNLGSGVCLSVQDLATRILDLMGKPHSLIQHIGDRPGQVDLHISSTEKATKMLGVEPARDIDRGLEETIRWYRDNQSWWHELEWMKSVRIFTKAGRQESH